MTKPFVKTTGAAFLLLTGILALAGCGGGGGGGSNAPSVYTIGGNISGLGSAQVMLLNNGGDSLTVATNGSFTFATRLATSSAYNVTVGTQPSGGFCTIANGGGTVGSGPVVNLAVSCIQHGQVITLAGSTRGYADGMGTAAQFYSPTGVAVDASGTAYVSDIDVHRIRKISPAGMVTTLAGSGMGSWADGTGTAANFRYPSGLAVDVSGTVYVADSNNSRIRKISPAGVVTTLAGDGTASYADGTGTAAYFRYPKGVAVDASGTVYVADTSNHRIRKISPAGVVTTLAGDGTASYADGTGTAAQFYFPEGIAVDASGTVYVADTSNHRIRKISPAGVVTTLAGYSTYGYADGTGTAAQFSFPRGIAVDASGAVYVADYYNHRIRKITPAGEVTTLAGSGIEGGYADGAVTSAKFSHPTGVAVDASGAVYVTDYYNYRIRKIFQAP